MERTEAKGKVIFRSVKDTPEERGVCGFRRRMITDEENEAANVTFLRVHDSKMHYHRGMTEFYFVLRGGGTITLDGETRPVAEGDLVMIPPGVRHTSDGEMEVLIVGVPPQETQDVHFD
jgi:quercetin dioxygenase-like cupin family protein